MEISVFVYRQLLPFISKLCIWREDLMPLFAEEQMFKDTTESTFSWYNFRLWNSETLWAPRCRHSCPTHPTAPPAACSHCSPTVWVSRAPCSLFAFVLLTLSFASSQGGTSKGKGWASPSTHPFVPRKTPARLHLWALMQPNKRIVMKYGWMQKAQIINFLKVCVQ